MVSSSSSPFTADGLDDGTLFLNPGSITGAYSSLSSKSTPSFITMAMNGKKVINYVYELVDGKKKVNKVEFVKK